MWRQLPQPNTPEQLAYSKQHVLAVQSAAPTQICMPASTSIRLPRSPKKWQVMQL
jgi:hypothetical protein